MPAFWTALHISYAFIKSVTYCTVKQVWIQPFGSSTVFQHFAYSSTQYGFMVVLSVPCCSTVLIKAFIGHQFGRIYPGNYNTIMFTWLCRVPWWRHQMETFSVLLALCDGNSPVTGEFPSQRPVTRGVGVFFDFRLNKRLNKPSRRRWFEMPSRSLWRQCNGDLFSAECELIPSWHRRTLLPFDREMSFCLFVVASASKRIIKGPFY